MNDNAYAFAIKNTLAEIKNICPDIANTFVFKEDGKIITKDATTEERIINDTIEAFDAILERADAISGLESVTFKGANGQVKIARMKDFYLTTVTSKEADENYVNTLTRVLIPTVIGLMEKIHSDSIDYETPTTVNIESPEDNDAEELTDITENPQKELPVGETATIESKLEPMEENIESEVNTEPLLPEPPANQFIVENLGGLLAPSDTVHIDNEVIAKWKELYDDKKIEEVDVETLSGKATRCKVKPIKDQKYKSKGIIQIPKKMQLTLETTKGALIMVKPVVK